VTRVACIGECMIELREMADGHLSRGYGGDTFNTAVYLARLGVPVDYVTALGDDSWSDEMIAGWPAEGVGTGLVMRVPGRVPGLYVIQTDEKGERRFSYWRNSAPARDLFALPQTAELVAALKDYDVLYLSGISLSLYGDSGRKRLFETIDRSRSSGHRFAFDTNFRPRGWANRDNAKAAYREAFARADILLASTEDLELLFGDGGVQEFLSCPNPSERVLKLAEPAGRVIGEGMDIVVRALPVAVIVDTTAAGDSFAAAYIAARLSGRSLECSVEAGHRLAGTVVCHPGAIIPASAMPADLNFVSTGTVQEKRP
jgi:2-dehydro-3-deoxygluconokinase